MRICWENLDKYQIYITLAGNFRSHTHHLTFYEKICPVCGEGFLARRRWDRKQGILEECCSLVCAGHFRRGNNRFLRDGYVVIWNPETRVGILEHRLMAERALGRKLRSDEMVHHVNGRKADNRNSNFLICTRSYHSYLNFRMVHLYQQEHFGG